MDLPLVPKRGWHTENDNEPVVSWSRHSEESKRMGWCECWDCFEEKHPEFKVPPIAPEESK